MNNRNRYDWEKECRPLLPKTGPGCARSVVSHNARPSPYKCDESPEILNSTSMTKF